MSYSLRDLLLLLEAQNQQAAMAPQDEVSQAQAMDTQFENNAEPQPSEEIPQETGVGGEGAGDADYLLNDPNAMPMPDPTPASEKQKAIKLFNLFEKMKSYGNVFEENLEEVDLSLIEEEDYKEFLKLRDSITKINDKIGVYMRESYIEDSHEKRLYMYILLRTELLTVIQSLRRVLGLNTEE